MAGTGGIQYGKVRRCYLAPSRVQTDEIQLLPYKFMSAQSYVCFFVTFILSKAAKHERSTHLPEPAPSFPHSPVLDQSTMQ